MSVGARHAGPDDVASLSRSLARAFDDDPVFEYVMPPSKRRSHKMERFFQLIAPAHLHHGHVYVSPAVEGCAMWDPPGCWRLRWQAQLRMALPMIRLYGRRSLGLLSDYQRLEHHHARHPPHWYLSMLGTDPDHQGKGIGASLLAPVLAICDRDGVGAYLESSKASNVPYYERFGFRVVEEHPFHPGGPMMWLMWREPQPPL